MIHYLELPYLRCKNCKHFDPTSSKAYTKCFDEQCPARSVQLVIRDSVQTLAQSYLKAIESCDFTEVKEILNQVEARGRGFAYQFKKEVQNRHAE